MPTEKKVNLSEAVSNVPPEGFDPTLKWPEKWSIVTKGSDPLYFFTYDLFDSEQGAEYYIKDHYSDKIRELVSIIRIPWVTYEKSYNPVYTSSRLPVWVAEPFWENNLNIHDTHCIHTISNRGSGLLRYIDSNEKGQKGIYTTIRAGRYLTKFFSNILTEQEIAFYAEWQISGIRASEYTDDSQYPLLFAKTSDEIVDVYINGPSSCMSYAQDKFRSCSKHPVSVYGAGDLAIAYIKDKRRSSKIIARVLVWPENKIYGRIYPNVGSWREDGFSSQSDAENAGKSLEARLRKLGYKSLTSDKKGFEGARLLKIPSLICDFYHMPYLDRDYRVDDDNDFFRMNLTGKYTGGNTSGIIEVPKAYKYKCCFCVAKSDEEKDFEQVVIRCLPSGNFTYATYCKSCSRNTYFCDGYKKRMSTLIHRTEVRGIGTVCRVWADTNAFISDIDSCYYPISEKYEMQTGVLWHSSYFKKHGFQCQITKQYWPNRFAHEKHPDIYMGVPEYEIASTYIEDTHQLSLV